MQATCADTEHHAMVIGVLLSGPQCSAQLIPGIKFSFADGLLGYALQGCKKVADEWEPTQAG